MLRSYHESAGRRFVDSRCEKADEERRLAARAAIGMPPQ